MSGAHIRVRKNKAGEPRFQVRYRVGGGDTPLENGGTYTSWKQADHVRDQILDDLAACRLRVGKKPAWIPQRRGLKLTSVYIARDEHGDVLYVGITGVGLKRVHQHADSSAWWPHVRSFEVEHWGREYAEARERHLIRELDPPYNRTHRVSGGRAA